MKKQKKCSMCNADINSTVFGSPNKALYFMVYNMIEIRGDGYMRYWYHCNYCPKCGRKLVYTPEELSTMYTEEQLRKFIKDPFRNRFERKNATPYQIAEEEDLKEALRIQLENKENEK